MRGAVVASTWRASLPLILELETNAGTAANGCQDRQRRAARSDTRSHSCTPAACNHRDLSNEGYAMTIAYDVLLDNTDEDCPIPTIRTKETLDSMSAGTVLKLVSRREGTVRNIRTFVKNNACELLQESRDAGEYNFFIKKL